MTESTRFTLRAHEGSEAPASELMADSNPTEQTLHGRVLEHQFHLPTLRFYVLFVTDGSPYEETLHVYLLDERDRVLEHSSIAAPYVPGVLDEVAIESDQVLTFRFQGERWRLAVHDRPAGLLRKRRLRISKTT